MKKVIIVDDEKPSKVTLAYWIGQELEELTNIECGAVLLEGVIITDALPLLREFIKKINKKDDVVVGFLFDIVDETQKEPKAGSILLDKVKADPELKVIPVVLYTSKHVLDLSVQDLLKRGAKAVIRRKSTGAQKGELGKQVLDAFEIPYTGSRTGSPGPH